MTTQLEMDLLMSNVHVGHEFKNVNKEFDCAFAYRQLMGVNQIINENIQYVLREIDPNAEMYNDVKRQIQFVNRVIADELKNAIE